MKKILVVLLVLLHQVTFGQQKNGAISGAILTSDGQPAQFVSVVVENTNKGATADEHGHFNIAKIAPGTYTIQIKYAGKVLATKQVTVASGETAMTDFALDKDIRSLQEVTVSSGYNKFANKESNDVARLPLKNLENPQVYNVVPKELLKDQVIVSYNDVLKNVTGVSQALVNGSNSFNLRGFFTTSYLRNGLQQSIGNSVEVANIERIEVLKGPSATLFGSSLTSFGGLLNRITKKPLDNFQGEVAYTQGGFGLNRVTADVNTPLSKEKGLYLRTNVAYDDEGSFQDAGFTKRFLFAPSFLYKVNDRTTILLDAEVYSQKANDFNRLFPSASFTLTNPRTLGIDYTKSYSNNDLYETQPSVSLFGQINYKISDQWTSQTAFSTTASSVEGYWSYNEIDGDSGVIRNPGYEHTNSSYVEAQQNFTGDFKLGRMRNRIVLGLDYYTSTINSSSASIYGYDEVSIKGHDPRYGEMTRAALDQAFASIPLSRGQAMQSTYSAYVSDVLNITNNLLVMASLRVDHFVNNGTKDYVNDTTTGKFNQTALSPKLGIVYSIIKDKVSLFGNYMNGFSNNAPVHQINGTYSTFKPSQAYQWEGGVKVDLFQGKLNGTVSYYHIDVNDVVHNSYKAGESGIQVQDGGQTSKGVEVELIANPVAGLNVIAGYAHNDIYTTHTDPDADGLHQWTGPAETANLWLSYHFLTTAVKGLGLGIGGNYNGKAYIQQSRSQGEFYMPEYTVLNAVLSYEKAAYRVSLKMDNLTNEVYWGSYISQMMPRRFSATLAVKF
jgi:iron complex outermembrane recepter protein